MTPHFGSLFSGIGGFDLGLERAGLTCAWQCEFDERARAVLDRHWPHVPVYEDVSTLERPPTVDVLCGGFPCQDLSVAGRRAGLAGERSGLFHQFMRLAGELAPRWVLVENVPGLLSSNEGRDMGVVVGALGELGYGWAYRVLDAQYFGVAQRRRRVFIVGCLGDAARACQVLFEPESCDGDSPPRREAGPRSSPDPERRLAGGGAVAFDWQQGDEGGDGRSWIVKQGDYTGSLSTTKVQAVAATVRTREGHGCERGDGQDNLVVAHSLRAQGQLAHREDIDTLIVADTLRSHPRPGSNSNGAVVAFYPHTGLDRAYQDDISPPVTVGSTIDIGNPPAVAYPVAVRGREEGQEWEVGEEPVYNALRAGDGGSSRANWALTDMAVRRLTPVECERLQGFPDGWTDNQPDSSRYRQLGNAVCVPVAEWIGHRIKGAA